MQWSATQSFPRILALIMAGGNGERLMPLTDHRSKPAVPFATQYRSQSLIELPLIEHHVGRVDRKTVIDYDPVTD